MSVKFSKKMLFVPGVVVVLAGGAGAYAYWSNDGTGTGGAATGTNVGVTVNQTSVITGLAPGVAAQTLSGNFDNTNAGPVYVTAVTATVSGTSNPGCDATDYIIAGTAPVNAQVAAGDDVGAWTGLTIQFNNKPAANQDACKDAVVELTYTSS